MNYFEIPETNSEMDNRYLDALTNNLGEQNNEVDMAPSMEVQAQEISEAFLEFPELRYENWEKLTPEERIDALQRFEYEVARIEHREPIPITMEDLGENVYGLYSPTNNSMTINSKLLEINSEAAYYEILDTYFHEGRHAYQTYNLEVEQVEQSRELVDSWNVNLNVLGYNSGDVGEFGFEEYYTQPIEVDARVFAEAVMREIGLQR